MSKELAPGIIKRSSTNYVDPKAIARREGWNVRFDMGEIELLAASIKTTQEQDPASGGLLNDIRVKRLAKPTADGKVLELVDGDRRLTAIELLLSRGVEFPHGIPAKIELKDADDKTLLVRMFTANTGKPLLPIEEAHAFRRMQKDHGMTIAEIEVAVGRSDNYIVGALALLDADASLVAAVVAGEIKPGVAKSIAVNARGDKKKQAEIVEEMKAAGTDKSKRRAVVAKIDDARRAKAEKRGVTLKMRALTDAALGELGTKIAKVLEAKVREAGFAVDDIETLLETIAKDEGMVAAYTVGVLYGLRAAAGDKVAAAKLDL